MRWLSVFLLFWLAACESPFTPAGAVRFAPPASYAAWWHHVEVCSGITALWQRVEWYRVDEWGFSTPGRVTAGYWTARHRITLAWRWADNSPEYFTRLVQHEMLHDLTQSADHGPLFTQCSL